MVCWTVRSILCNSCTSFFKYFIYCSCFFICVLKLMYRIISLGKSFSGCFFTLGTSFLLRAELSFWLILLSVIWCGSFFFVFLDASAQNCPMRVCSGLMDCILDMQMSNAAFKHCQLNHMQTLSHRHS